MGLSSTTFNFSHSRYGKEVSRSNDFNLLSWQVSGFLKDECPDTKHVSLLPFENIQKAYNYSSHMHERHTSEQHSGINPEFVQTRPEGAEDGQGSPDQTQGQRSPPHARSAASPFPSKAEIHFLWRRPPSTCPQRPSRWRHTMPGSEELLGLLQSSLGTFLPGSPPPAPSRPRGSWLLPTPPHAPLHGNTPVEGERGEHEYQIISASSDRALERCS